MTAGFGHRRTVQLGPDACTSLQRAVFSVAREICWDLSGVGGLVTLTRERVADKPTECHGSSWIWGVHQMRGGRGEPFVVETVWA